MLLCLEQDKKTNNPPLSKYSLSQAILYPKLFSISEYSVFVSSYLLYRASLYKKNSSSLTPCEFERERKREQPEKK